MKCVHCLVEDEDWNWDHVFPVSWYPNTTPPNLEKWKVPSCRNCNSEYGKIEQDLLIRFAMCLDPDDTASSGIVERALRALNPNEGRNERDKKARAAKRTQLLKYVEKLDEFPQYGVLPDFSENEPEKYGEYISVLISRNSLLRLAEKIVKGIIYIEHGTYIEKNHPIDMYVLDESSAESIEGNIKYFGGEIERGPGLVIRRALLDNDPPVGFFSIEIWGARKLFVSLGVKD